MCKQCFILKLLLQSQFHLSPETHELTSLHTDDAATPDLKYLKSSDLSLFLQILLEISAEVLNSSLTFHNCMTNSAFLFTWRNLDFHCLWSEVLGRTFYQNILLNANYVLLETFIFS